MFTTKYVLYIILTIFAKRDTVVFDTSFAVGLYMRDWLVSSFGLLSEGLLSAAPKVSSWNCKIPLMLEMKQLGRRVFDQVKQKFTWEESNPAGGWFNAAGLNLTVLGLMAETVAWEDSISGDTLIAPARSSEKDLKVEQVGLEATGLAITTLSASLISIFKYVFLLQSVSLYVCFCLQEKQNHHLSFHN